MGDPRDFPFIPPLGFHHLILYHIFLFSRVYELFVLSVCYVVNCCWCLFLCVTLIRRSGDVAQNPGPTDGVLRFASWNVHGLNEERAIQLLNFLHSKDIERFGPLRRGLPQRLHKQDTM
jgi:hypothetical protein